MNEKFLMDIQKVVKKHNGYININPPKYSIPSPQEPFSSFNIHRLTYYFDITVYDRKPLSKWVRFKRLFRIGGL